MFYSRKERGLTIQQQKRPTELTNAEGKGTPGSTCPIREVGKDNFDKALPKE